MDIRILNKMVSEINKLLGEKWDFMAAKRATLNSYNFSGEKQRKEYSSILSKHFGKKGGKASAKKKAEWTQLKKKRDELLKEVFLARTISDAENLQHQEAVRAGEEE